MRVTCLTRQAALSPWGHGSTRAAFSTIRLGSVHPKYARGPLMKIALYGSIASVGLASTLAQSPVHCEDPHAAAESPPRNVEHIHEFPNDLPPPPQSSVSLYGLSFGVVTGICAGIFVKKGAKAIAFVVGGVFVLLQYLQSLSFIRVNWAHIDSRFEQRFYIAQADGTANAPSVRSVLRWLIDFLTADFQPRASFLAGLALGLRIG
ncbi:hypothetical protein FISHEDRAFT_71254 [Fistulina hepatica ATCC 64428]|nr:hypothetical protein FISHEDRAFT_71254 [Fistulina hepatica ATCC 64428]